MRGFKKGHNLKIACILISIILLCVAQLHPYPLQKKDTLRVPSSFQRAGYKKRLDKSKITAESINKIKETFKDLPVVSKILEKLLIKLEDKLNDDQFKMFYEDSVHGFQHGIEITKQVFKWVGAYKFKVDQEALAIGTFLHDICGLGSFGNEIRKNHHVYGAKLVDELLKKEGWDHKRIKKVKHIISSHRGIPKTYPFKDYPKTFIDMRALNMPRPLSLEAKLVRDADTHDQLANPKQLFKTTADFRRRYISQDGKGVTERYYDSRVYAVDGDEHSEVKNRVDVIVEYKKRRLAKETDILEFLLGKLLENCDPEYYFIPEVQEAIRKEAPIFFKKFLEITKNEAVKEGYDFYAAIKLIEKVIQETGAREDAGNKWKQLNELHRGALTKALADLESMFLYRYIKDNFILVSGEKELPLMEDDLHSILSPKTSHRMMSTVPYETNFIESLGDLIIFVVKETEKKDLITLIENTLLKIEKESKSLPGSKITEAIGQLQMLCYETFSEDGFSGARLMTGLIKKFNEKYSIEHIGYIAELRRKLEYLQKYENITDSLTVEMLRKKIDRLDNEIFNDGWVEKHIETIDSLLRKKLKEKLHFQEIKGEDMISQIRKIHKSQRGLAWGGEDHTVITLDRNKDGATTYASYIKIDGKNKIVSSQLCAKNFLRTAAVLDITQRTGIGSRLLVEGIKKVIENGYTSAYWRVLENNEASNKMSNIFLVGLSGNDERHASYREVLRKTIQRKFKDRQNTGIFVEQKIELQDFGYGILAYEYRIDFMKTEGKEDFVKSALNLVEGEEIRNAIKILDLIGLIGFEKVKVFINERFLGQDQKKKALELIAEIVTILEENNTWAYTHT
ncbi:MAG: HD domain-containing protein, partial [Candidatus Omnitrophica bacterium]|nr:HD domain-containing protein [Candidatus Omnitrophota bacterium]